MTLGDLFALSLSGRRDAPALDGDRTLTFGELDAEVDRLARVLASRGVGSGSRVCLYLRNSPALVAGLPRHPQARRHRRADEHPLSRP